MKKYLEIVRKYKKWVYLCTRFEKVLAFMLI